MAVLEGAMRTCYLHPDLLREVSERIAQVVIAWPLLVVGSVDERLDVEGFRLPDEADVDEDLWRVWQDNDADEESGLAHVDALVMRRSYACVGANEEDADTPLVTYESPLEVYADIDPRNRRVRAALRRWTDYQDSLVRLPERYATLYLPDATIQFDFSGAGWRETGRDPHRLGVVPVVPIVNRARLSDRLGHSELDPVLPLSRGANKVATDMMVAAEKVALPLRGFIGVSPTDFEDHAGVQLTPSQILMKQILAVPVEDAGQVRQFEFAAAQLSNFTNVLDQLAQLVSGIAGLPPHYLGFRTDNPASADAIRSAEARLVKRAERKQRAFGAAHERTMRLVRRIQSGDWDPRLRRLETVWRNAATPTVAQRADAAVKLYSAPNGPIVPLRQTREDLGYSAAQIERMEIEDAAAVARETIGLALPPTPTLAGRPPEPAGAAA